ncbi:MAG: family 10 glycosylhydrolase [Leptolyngbya sp. SIO1E4]|nr:family 10 glycosylhydrolase [Leptolyngbya sp. SIO1E4]
MKDLERAMKLSHKLGHICCFNWLSMLFIDRDFKQSSGNMRRSVMANLSKLVVCFFSGMIISILLALASASGHASTGGEQTTEVNPATGVQTGLEVAQENPDPESPQIRNRPSFIPQPSRPLPSRSEDPADQIAPPGLDVQPGDAPITPYMAIAMRQELDNLVGRFESALFLADAAEQPAEVQVQEVEAALTASADASGISVASEPALNPVLVEARQLIQDWTGLIENRAYREARDRWLNVRQTLWANFPTDRTFAQPEVRAMWLDRGSIVRAGSRQGLATLFDNMKESGINTVFFETVNASYPIYPSRIAPLQNPLARRWNPLEAAVDLAHERNMELHAWMWVFAAGNQRHNGILNLPTEYLGPVLNSHPNWAAYDNEGNYIPRGQTKPFFDPANPEVRRYLLALVDEIISNYDVDGLQLDYIRYPFQDPGAERTYGYGLAARQQFRRLTGVDPAQLTPRVDPWLPASERERQRSLWERWTEFRIEQVTSFVEETSKLVRSKRPDITLSTAVFAIPEHERLQKIQQDWNSWAEEGLVDWIVLMSYAQDTNRFEQLIKPWVLEADYTPTLVIPGMRLLNMSVPAMIDQMQALRDLPAPGYALFATDNLDTRIQTVLNSTQGSHGDWVPQQAPYKTAAQRFQAMQREWNWLLSNGQLGLEPRLADAWIQRVNGFGNALNELADGAANTNIEDLQSQIQDLKRDLGVGMRLQTATTREYRFQAWENRLEAISRFLTYGAAQRS